MLDVRVLPRLRDVAVVPEDGAVVEPKLALLGVLEQATNKIAHNKQNDNFDARSMDETTKIAHIKQNDKTLMPDAPIIKRGRKSAKTTPEESIEDYKEAVLSGRCIDRSNSLALSARATAAVPAATKPTAGSKAALSGRNVPPRPKGEQDTRAP